MAKKPKVSPKPFEANHVIVFTNRTAQAVPIPLVIPSNNKEKKALKNANERALNKMTSSLHVHHVKRTSLAWLRDFLLNNGGSIGIREFVDMAINSLDTNQPIYLQEPAAKGK